MPRLLGRFSRRRLHGRDARVRGLIITQHDVLNVRRVGVGFVSGACERQGRHQLRRLDRIGQCLKELERAEAALQQAQTLAVGGEDT